jgi:type II secretory pathway pseudopilin PulG
MTGRTPARRTVLTRESGVTFVEITVVMAVLAIVASILVPSVADSISDARFVSAKTSVNALCVGLQSMLRDTGSPFVMRDAHDGPGQTVAAQVANTVKMLASEGATPDVDPERRSSVGMEWDAPIDNQNVQSFADHLVTNEPGGNPSRGYPRQGAFGWRGAYLTPPLSADPWGHRFASNVWLLNTRAVANIGHVVMVLSAGPNGRVDTRFDAPFQASGGDDLYCIVSAGQ